MTTCASRMSQKWKDGITLDIHKEMMHVTLAIISKAVLGSEIKSDGDEVGDSLLTCMKYFNRLQMPFGELIEKIPFDDSLVISINGRESTTVSQKFGENILID